MLAWTLKNASAHSEFQEVAALTAGRLTRHSVVNQDAFVHAGGVDALHRLLGADWGEARRTAGVQAAAANALSDVMASNTAAKAAVIRQGGLQSLRQFRLVQFSGALKVCISCTSRLYLCIHMLVLVSLKSNHTGT